MRHACKGGSGTKMLWKSNIRTTLILPAILMLPGISFANSNEAPSSFNIGYYCQDRQDTDWSCDQQTADCESQDEKEKPESDESVRRALPPPFASPPFPSAEYQGSPLIGVPPNDTVYPLMEAIYSTPCGEAIKKSRVKAYGWINGSGNLSNCRNSNTPDSYWIVPNRFELDQFIFRVEREVDSVQTDHVDIGFRSTFLYGIDYRYMTSGGWTSYQLLKDNRLYGYDFTEQYIDIYTPAIAQGMIVRVGRWIACPDIETQFAPDNYMGSHSLLFTFDTYTQTGIMATIMLNENWTVQAALHAGTDMAPWYKGAVPRNVWSPLGFM
jgi:hypothetical protein